MKRVLFSMVLLMSVSFSFAQMKSVKEAKNAASSSSPDLNRAEQLINEALKNPESKDNPETWNVAGLIQKRMSDEEGKKALLKQPFDTLKH